MSDLAHLHVRTPEHVGLTYPLAGVGNRFLAAFVDGALLFGMLLTFSVVGLNLAPFLPLERRLVSVVMGVAIVVLLLIAPFSYYVFFETFWNGQTIGKRLVGIRVLRDDGSPVDFVGAATRNLIRTIDVLPPALALDVVVMLLSRKGQRLGDIVAGTVVVKARLERDFGRYRTRASGMSPPRVTTRALSGEAQRLVREFALREGSLGDDARRNVARSVAATIRSLVPEAPDHPDDVEFLRTVAASLRAQGDASTTH